MSGMQIAGHRGLKALYPENTLLSFQKAAEAGVDMVELDLRLTADGQVVILHDADVRRTTNGSGPVAGMTLLQLKALDAGSWFGEPYAGLRVPTLQEFCEWASAYPAMLFNVEIKEYTRETVDKGLAILRRHGLAERCVFASFEAGILRYLHEDCGLPTQGFPLEKMINARPDSYRDMTAVGIEMDILTPALVEDMRRMGIKPWAYCPDTLETMEKAIACDVELVTVNDHRPAVQLLRGGTGAGASGGPLS